MHQKMPTWRKAADGDPLSTEVAAGSIIDRLATPSVALGLIGVYLLIHFLLRLVLSPTLGIDDAEQVLFAQRWDAGYRFRQPPLFTWLLMPVTAMIGPGLLAVSIVRYVLLGLTYLVFYLTARRCIGDPLMAALATFSFSLIYVFAYYAHHDLTHTTALGAMIALAFYGFVRLAERPSWPAYLVVGLVFGLGVLGKWNFVMLAIGLPLTCLALPAWRHLVLTPKLPAAIAVMTAVILPTGLWMLEHGQSVQGVSGNILGGSGGFPSVDAMLQGAWALLSSTFLFPMPFLAIFLLLFTKESVRGLAVPKAATARTVPPSFFGWLTLILLALHALLIPVFGAIDFTERWLHPVLMGLPLFLFGLLERGRPARPKISTYLVIIAILIAVTLGARLYRFLEGGDQCSRCREFAPFAELAKGLERGGFEHGTIVADGLHIGGNLRMLFADSRVIDPAFPLALWPESETDGACLLVWRDDVERAGARRDAIKSFARRELGLTAGEPAEKGRIEAMLIGSSSRRYALGFELYRETAGGCR